MFALNCVNYFSGNTPKIKEERVIKNSQRYKRPDRVTDKHASKKRCILKWEHVHAKRGGGRNWPKREKRYLFKDEVKGRNYRAAYIFTAHLLFGDRQMRGIHKQIYLY